MDKKYILLFLLIAARLVNLDADPGITSYLREPLFREADEAFWINEIRNMLLFGNWKLDDYGGALIVAPLFVYLGYAVLSFLGVSLATAKLLGAVPSVLFIITFYFLVGRADKKLAFLATLLLSLDLAFFGMSRLGYPIGLRFFLFLASFLFLSKSNSALHYAIAGILFGIAVLVQITTIYFAPIIILYLASQKIRNSLPVQKVLGYLAGLAIVCLISLLYYVQLTPDSFAWLSTVARVDSATAFAPTKFLQFLGVNPYFAMPSIFLLTLLSLVYFKEKNIKEFFIRPIEKIRNLTEIEILAFSWFFGTLLSVFLLSDLNIGRYDPLIVSLVLFSSLALQQQPLPLTYKKEGTGWIIFLIILAIFIILSFLYFAGKAFFGVSAASFPVDSQLLKLSVVAISIALILFAIIIFRKISSRHLANMTKWLPSLVLLMLVTMFSFLLVNKLFILFKFLFNYEDPIIGVIIQIFSAGIIGYAAYKLVKQANNFTKQHIFHAFAALCIIVMGYYLLFPAFTIKQASIRLSEISEPGDVIIGTHARYLIFENRLHYVHWTPNNEDFSSLNYDVVERFRPRFFLETISRNNEPLQSYQTISPANINQTLIYLDVMGLNPIFGKPQFIANLYRINYTNS